MACNDGPDRREFLRTVAIVGAAAAMTEPVSAEAAQLPLALSAGGGSAEITPPLDVGILMSSGRGRWEPFDGVRLPLYARAVVIRKAHRPMAVVSLDLLGLAGEAVGGMRQFKDRVAAQAGGIVAADDLILASTHTHSGPASCGLTDLVHTKQFKSWVGHLARQIGSAIRGAANSLQPCRLIAGSLPAAGLAVNRRMKTTRGVVFRTRKTPPELIIGPEGPIDEYVHVAAFIGRSGRPVAMLVNATAHPVHEMCIRQVSPDYPGEMSIELQRRHPATVALFLQGCAGNINPPSVSGGAADARRHGQRLAELVDKSIGRLHPVSGDEAAVYRRSIELPLRDGKGRPVAKPLSVPIAAVRIGDAAFVFLPGEPFVEIGMAIREASPFGFTAVAGYTGDWIGYIPTDRAFDNGGYEVRPGRWSRVARGSASILQRQAIDLLRVAHAGRKGREDSLHDSPG